MAARDLSKDPAFPPSAQQVPVDRVSQKAQASLGKVVSSGQATSPWGLLLKNDYEFQDSVSKASTKPRALLGPALSNLRRSLAHEASPDSALFR